MRPGEPSICQPLNARHLRCAAEESPPGSTFRAKLLLHGPHATLPCQLQLAEWPCQTSEQAMTQQRVVMGRSQVLRQLVIEMRAGAGGVPPHLKSFVMERCAGAVCLAGLQNSRVDVR